MKLNLPAILLIGFTLTSHCAENFQLKSGAVLSNATVFGKNNSRVNVSHTKGTGWYSVNEFSEKTRKVIDQRMSSVETLAPPGQHFITAADMGEMFPILIMRYGLDDDGQIVRGIFVSGKVINVLDENALLVSDDGRIVRIDNVCGSYVDDDIYSGVVGSTGRRFKYTAVSGTQKTVDVLQQLPPLTEDAIRKVGLAYFPEYLEKKKEKSEHEAREESARYQKLQADRQQSKINEMQNNAALRGSF